jgi:PAS domain-containing protein
VLPKAYGDLAPKLESLMRRAVTKGWAQDCVTIGGQGLTLDLCRSAGQLVWSFKPVAPGGAREGIAQPSVAMARMNGDSIVTDVNAAFQARFGEMPRWIDVLANGNGVLRNQVQQLKTLDGERNFHVLDHWPSDETEELYFFPVTDEQQVSTQSYWDLFEHLSVPLIKLSTKGGIKSVNAAARSLFGKKINIGHDITEVFISNQQSLLGWISDVSEGKVWNKSIVLQLPGAKSGTVF